MTLGIIQPRALPHMCSIGVKLNNLMAEAKTARVWTNKNNLALAASSGAPLTLMVSHADPTRCDNRKHQWTSPDGSDWL